MIFNGPLRIIQRSLMLGSLIMIQTFGSILAQPVKAEMVELQITGYWTEKGFKVIDPSDRLFDPANPKFDGKVFGVAPSNGNLTIRLLVNTDGAVHFAKGSTYKAVDSRDYTLAHDFYGYREVALVDGVYSFGNAIWRSDGIVAGLEGPDRVKAALWTDVDITRSDPKRLSFRMFGKAEGLQADLFFGSRTPSSIGGQFIVWEYYQGEEIRSDSYSAKATLIGR
ncbi:MAG TPA: hypothetical protein PKD26_11135 [Pyrinomonadaceae bacterium]|nr:hypothetical protein [Pyrinomonadaceae bacterium]